MSRSPAGVDASAPPAGLPKQRQPNKLFAWLIGLPDRPGWGQLITVFAAPWPFIKWVVITLIVGGPLLTLVNWFFDTAQENIPDWHTLIVARLALAHPLRVGVSGGLALVMIACSFGGYRMKKAAERRKHEVEEQARLTREEAEQQAREQREEAERKAKEQHEATEREAQRQREEAERERRARPFVLKPVEQLDPHKEPYIHQYVKDAYVPREADREARQALQAAMNRTSGAPLGICIVGRPTLGKTRLAFETMCAELAGWTFVRWPHNTRPEDFDFAAQKGQKLVLWLDDLHEYAGQTEAPTLLDLPRHFEDAAERLVILATCRDGEEQQRTETTLSGLLERLTTVQPAEITSQQADTLTADLERAGQDAQRDEFDGTPGSVVLGVRRMTARYNTLEEDAQRVLLAMKLLRSARIYDYPVPRVRAVAVEVFHLEAPRWHDALGQAAEQGFLRREALAAGEADVLAPLVDVYLDRVVPAPTGDMADYWVALKQNLLRHNDAYALVHLGIAFGQRPIGDLRANQREAEACCRAALNVYTRQAAPADWATLQNNLGVALSRQAELGAGAEQGRLLGEAMTAYRRALEVRTQQSLPADWAQTQSNLGNVLGEQARLVEGVERIRLLIEAVATHRAVLTVYRREGHPTAWATTQHNLGNALSEQAGLAEGADKARLLAEAVTAYRAALEERTSQNIPVDWARTQNNLGNSLQEQAKLTEGAEQARLLAEAAEAYRAALKVWTRQNAPAEWATTQNNLGVCLNSQAKLTEGAEQARLLTEAAEAYQAALEVWTRQSAPSKWAQAQGNLGVVLRRQADLVTGAQRVQLLIETVATYQAAADVFTRQSAPMDWAGIQNNLGSALRSQAHAVEGVEQIRLLAEAEAAYKAGLEVRTRQNAPAEWAAAQCNLAIIYAERALALEERDKDTPCQVLREAQQYVTRSLEVYTREAMPAYHLNAMRVHTWIKQKLQELGCKDADLSAPGE